MGNTARQHRILIIDDSTEDRQTYKPLDRTKQRRGFSVLGNRFRRGRSPALSPITIPTAYCWTTTCRTLTVWNSLPG